MERSSIRKHMIISWGILMFLFIPMIATLAYSLSSSWGATILPDGITFKWYKDLFFEKRFLEALGRSINISVMSLSVSTLVIVPAVLVIYYYFPKGLKIMDILSIIPFTIPGVVMVVGFLKIYSSGPIVLVGTKWILIGAHFTLIFPFLYRGIINNLEGIDVRKLIEAANMLGASNFQGFKMVIIPNLSKGFIATLLLSFSLIFGEFLYSNMLAGGSYETIQVYLFNMKAKSGHFTGAIVITYFLFILATTIGAFKLNNIIKKEK
ncbi:MAG: ABC transporter permease [Psychrilyobacter sp.]|uniref:ABC transporter permease n=1 Tax=Psychrilyobacter sp. TaxID=2586924 RepID=UPI003C70902D